MDSFGITLALGVAPDLQRLCVVLAANELLAFLAVDDLAGVVLGLCVHHQFLLAIRVVGREGLPDQRARLIDDVADTAQRKRRPLCCARAHLQVMYLHQWI